jgi:uncharacterized repeat protein (TIGR01451 family)
MPSRMSFSRLVIVAALLASFAVATCVGTADGLSVDTQRIGESGTPVAILRWDPVQSSHRVAEPLRVLQSGTQGATFIVNYLPGGTKDAVGTNCYDWPNEAKSAFFYATSIWSALIESPIPIEIDACWADLDPGVLGYAGGAGYVFRGNTLYPVALANALFGTDANGETAEMNVTYNRQYDWYWGTDGNPPSDKVDFATVVLHEVCHGLGFSGTMVVAAGLGYWGFGIVPFAADFDRHAETGSGQPLLTFDYGSSALGVQLTSDDLFFHGPQTNSANGGVPARLFAPANWMPGSSYVHLDELYNGTEHALMTYSLPSGESLHSPGQVALGILQDVGWQLTQPLHDLELTMGNHSEAVVAPGDSVTYTVALRNIGAGAASQVIVTNIVPSHVVSATWAASTSFSGAEPQPDMTYVWELESLEAGASGVFTVAGRIDPALTATFPIVTAAEVTAQGVDTEPSNNSDTIIIGGHLTFLPLAVVTTY